MADAKRNFRGEPIHQAPFIEAVERLRSRVVGKQISVEDNIPVNRKRPESGRCLAVHIVPDYDSINLELDNGIRYGAQFPTIQEAAEVEDRPGVISLKVEVLSGCCDRWITILDQKG